MKHILTFIAVLILLTGHSGLHAQTHADLRFKHIGIDRGLSHTTVSSIVQDSTGYIWAATPDGLNRYDGYGFRVYRHAADDSTSLGANVMRLVKTDTRGRLWAAGGRTLSLYDASRDRFVNYRLPDSPTPDITDLLPLPDGRLLAATLDALYTFDPAEGTFTAVAPTDGGVKDINALERDGSTIYIGTRNGRLTTISSGARARTIELPGAPVVVALLADGPSRLLIATEGSGLMSYDKTTGRVTTYRAAGTPGLGNDYVRSLAHDSRGRVWVGTFTGLSIFDPADGTFTLYDPKPEGLESLSHTSVRCIYADRQGGMWLGTFFGGLNYYHPLKNQFGTLRQSLLHPSLNDNVISAMAEDTDGTLWIGTNNGGLNRYNPATGTFAHYTKSDGLGSNDVKAVYIDPDSRHIYIGAHLGGLSVLDKTSGTLSRTAPGVKNVFGITPSRRPGHLWLATLDDIRLLDKATGTTTAGPASGLKHITGFYRDADARLWVYGEDGLRVYTEDASGRLTPATGTDTLPCRDTWVYDVYQTRTGQYIYVATADGLWRYTPADGTTLHITTDEGLPNDIVYGLLEDDGGNLWASTNSGLARYSPADGSLRAYSARDGLQSNQFMPKSFLRASSGRMYFGGINGLSYFDPSVLESNPYSPAPVITGLRLFNRPVTPGDDTGLLDRSISEVEKISFGVDQTVFTIDFTVCNYVAGEHNTFAYMLEGLDKDWYTTDGPGSVTYSNLPPGNYRFLLRAANNDGVWCSTVTGLDISIARVWYKRWWAVTLFVLLALGMAAACIWYFWRKRAIEDQLRMERHERRRQRELNEMKVRFFINMSHELRTPLTLIQLPIEELLARAADPKTVQKLTTVKNNANRILHIVNQLLDYRRAEMGMFKLQVMPTSINELARKVFANYEYQAQRRGVTYTLESDVPDSPQLCDPQYLELIFNNLLSNAFKYTPRGQSIAMRLHLAGQGGARSLCVTVADTGCGIPADKLPEIFTRFYKVHDHAAGSGIGLSLVKRLVELHHGTIGVTSELGAGTVFTVEIPVDEAAYSREELAPATPGPELPGAPVSLPAEDYFDDFTDIPAAGDTDDSATGRRTILVADDNPEILKYICEALGSDYNVVPAADGAKAIQILSQQSVDLIVTDVMMPDIDGVQLCRTVKRNLRTSHIPVIILSAKSDTADQLDGLKVGADDYIGKPFSMPVLSAKIRNLLRTRDQAVRHFNDTADIEPEKVALNPLDEAFLKKAMTVMEEHLDDSQFSTDAFAREMCMSRSNLHLKMKALTGESTNEFIRRFRLRHALDLLKSGRYTVSEVSAMVGYGTPSYFATSFKKFFGSLPSDYVKKD